MSKFSLCTFIFLFFNVLHLFKFCGCPPVSRSLTKNKLLLVQVVWRHGDRAPLQGYPTDKYKENVWPLGWGELSPVGVQQAYELGQLLRQTYVSGNQPFLNETYKPKEAGNTYICCPRAEQIYAGIKKSPEFVRFDKKWNTFLQFLTEKSGYNVTYENIYNLNDVVSVEKLYNLSQPTWINRTVSDMLQILTYKANAFIYGIAQPYSQEMLRLRGGNILKEIIQRMNAKVSCSNSSRSDCRWINNLKYFTYSAHDTTVGPLIYTLGAQSKVLSRGQFPDYASAIAVELWTTESGPAVKVLYRSGPEQPFFSITRSVEGCEDADLCSLQQFNRRSENFMPNNIIEECKATGTQNTISCANMKIGEKSLFGNFVMPYRSH